MADFFYTSSSVPPRKLEQIYSETDTLKDNMRVYRNYTSEVYEYENNSAYIIGTSQVIEKDKETFIKNLLAKFDESLMPFIQRELIGQYIILIYANKKWYIQSDFVNIRPIFYDLEKDEVSSNLGAMSSFHPGFDTAYKSLEFKAMDKCLYPVMLGIETSNKAIRRLQPCQYIVIDEKIEVRNFTLYLDNTKISSAEACAEETRLLLTKIIRKYADKRAVSTITGGYDSRLISSLCAINISNLELRISTIKEKGFDDLSIAKRIAKKLKKKLNIYKTAPQTIKEEYTFLTDGLSKENNMIIMDMIKHGADFQIGFGGAMGTELYSTLPFHHKKQLVDSFVSIAEDKISDDDTFIQSFRLALNEQIEHIEHHLLLKEKNPRDLVRLFLVLMTARFSSPLLALSDIYGHDIEPFATFPVIESGLRIPYHFQGDSKTFGRFYLIPKLVMKKTNYGIGAIDSTHYQPLLPVSILTLPHYIIGKLKTKIKR